LHTDRCGAILDENPVTIALDRLFISEKPGCRDSYQQGLGCGVEPSCASDVYGAVEEEVVYCDDAGNCGLRAAAPRGLRNRRRNKPLVSYVPPQPPKFLPVPTQPAFTEVSTDSPVALRGSVERNFGPQLTFPGRD